MWYAYYKLEPFGNEQELLARCAAFLQIIAMKDYDKEGVKAVGKYAQHLFESLMPSEWVGQPDPSQAVDQDSVKSFEAVVSKVFG